MIFERPLDSPEQTRFLALAESADIDKGAVQKLFWLIDAHPRLLSFVQIAQNLVAIFDAVPLVDLGEASGLEWPALIPTWQRFCRWVSDSQGELAKEPVLASAFLLPRIKRKNTDHANSELSHPLNDRGLSRHGVYASLWNRHESGGGKVTGGSCSGAYLSLQAHLVLALATVRETCTSLAEYLNYTAEDEFSRQPRSSYPASLAVRNLSRTELTPLLGLLAPETPFSAFVKNLTRITTDRTEVPGVSAKLAIEYPRSFLRLFGPTQELLESGTAAVASRSRSRSGDTTVGERSSRHLPGYINLTTHLHRHRIESPDDWAGAIDVVCINPDSDEETRLVELAGEAPGERERPVLALYDPNELKGAIARARTAERIRTVVAQRFAWDLPQPTAEQLCQLGQAAQARWRTFLDQPESLRLQREVQVALMLETMLLFGKNMEAVRFLTLRRATSAPVREFSLLIGEDKDGQARPLGWRLPVIEPLYRTAMTAQQLRHARPLAQSFVVPDISGLGQRIVDYCTICGRVPPERVFTLRASTFGELLEDWRADTRQLAELTPLRLQRVLETTVFAQTGDWSIAWLVSGDETRVGETRLYYSGYSVPALQATYSRAVTEILGRIGWPAGDSVAPPRVKSGPMYAGARFLPKPQSVRDLLHRLRDGMKAFCPGGERTAEWVAYHNRFTLYCWLMQALTTGMRAINDPTEIIDQLRGNSAGSPTVTLADKETVFLDRARPVRLPGMIELQLATYRRHAAYIVRALSLGRPLLEALKENAPLFVLSERKKPGMLTRGWIEQQLADIGYPFPANFGRAFLRTELIANGCPAESVDALMGHASAGEKPFAAMATFDYDRHFRATEDAILAISRDIGLVPVASRLLAQ